MSIIFGFSQSAKPTICVRDLPLWTGLARTRTRELIEKGQLPRPFQLSDDGRGKGLFEDDLLEWQERRSFRTNAANEKSKHRPQSLNFVETTNALGARYDG
jgi:predicted DNA-binding transcriptional regulator AlpA